MKRADIYLVENGFYESRSKAQSAIKAGCVKVDGRVLKKPSEKLAKTATIEAQAEHPWVSRGGLKLAHALEKFSCDVRDLTCLDVGASTGGFCDVLLSSGARLVYAVDVGHGQLHERLQGNSNIISMEGVDARSLTEGDFATLPEIIVCDVSFISASKVLDRVMDLVMSGTRLITLVKPQFEVGPDGIERGGIVKNRDLAKRALSDFSAWVHAKGWQVLDFTDSPIKGGSGNEEFLLYARKKKPGEPG